MSVILTEFSMPSKPMYGDPKISGPALPLTGTTGAADIKGAMPVATMAGRTNELDRCDSAALIKLAIGQARSPKRSEMLGTVTDPMIDYVYSADETFRGWWLVPGYISFWRCVDNTTTITVGITLDLATTGSIKGMTDSSATVGGATTLLVAHGADGSAAYSVPGENIPLSPKFVSFQDRATSATESWLPAMMVGR